MISYSIYVLLFQNEALQAEIKDIQAEFEFDRIDYLDTIRKSEQDGLWKQEVISRIHPCLRRDCNYVNLDKIRVCLLWILWRKEG